MSLRCVLCGAPARENDPYCSKQCAHAAKEAAKDNIEARLRRAFQRRRRPPSASPDPDAEQLFFEVEGLWTPGCANAAEEVLRSVPGVLDALVVAETGRGRAFFDPERVSARDVLRVLRRYGLHARVVRDAWARAEGFSRAWEIALVVRLGVAATLTLNVLYFSLVRQWMNTAREAENLSLLMFFLSLPVLFYAGFPVLSNAVWSIARRRVSADLLAAGAAMGAFVLSLPSLFEKSPAYFDAACCAVVVTLFARLCEYRARRRLARAGERLTALLSGSAVRLRRGEQIPCGVSELRPGDVVLVEPGGRVPVDGDVVEGSGVLEPLMGGATELSPGDRVAAGGRLASGRLAVRAERTGPATAIGEYARLIEGSINSGLPGTPAAARGLILLGGGIATFALMALTWETKDPTSLAAVLLAASPAAIALLPAVSSLSAMGRAAERGVAFRGGDALAAVAGADAAVFHRSALLEPRAMATPLVVEASPEEFWSVVASLVAIAPGPAAAALRERARHEGAQPLVPAAPSEGRLARARIEGRDAALGDRRALEALGWISGPGVERARDEESRGRSVVWVGWDGEIRGAIAVDASLRTGAETLGASLSKAGVLPCLTGADASSALQAQAEHFGLDLALPEDRLSTDLERRRKSGKRTLMAARSSTDAPAGSDAADAILALDCAEESIPEWSTVVALGPDPRAAEVALGSARRALAARRTGGVVAFLYHAAALPCAAAGLLSPLVATGLAAACGLYLISIGFRAGGNPTS